MFVGVNFGLVVCRELSLETIAWDLIFPLPHLPIGILSALRERGKAFNREFSLFGLGRLYGW